MSEEKQLSFDAISEEWKGMPEYVQVQEKPYRTLRVNFRNEEDFNEFCKLIGQDLMEKIKSTWFPKLERGKDSNLRYVDEEKSTEV